MRREDLAGGAPFDNPTDYGAALLTVLLGD